MVKFSLSQKEKKENTAEVNGYDEEGILGAIKNLLDEEQSGLVINDSRSRLESITSPRPVCQDLVMEGLKDVRGWKEIICGRKREETRGRGREKSGKTFGKELMTTSYNN
ncbi:hypothetical protein Hamer_G005654 [Homarus americanus]|uniref:Uncharacterized protein n=1 Tax=Homarus americanus TaxID=6706 RepID=A0A8J5MX32_HOMAM|nr:hypothetical protein Hamer_G005654 [Homarus americanus]